MNAPLLAPAPHRRSPSHPGARRRPDRVRTPATRERHLRHLLADRVKGAGHVLACKALVPDDRSAIRARCCPGRPGAVDAIVTTGGTGLTRRDVTPEALEPLFDKKIDGFFRRVPSGQLPVRRPVDPAVARDGGIDRGVFVFCLPGSTGR